MEEVHGVNLNVDRDQGENKVNVLGICALLVRSKTRLSELMGAGRKRGLGLENNIFQSMPFLFRLLGFYVWAASILWHFRRVLLGLP